MLTLKETSKLLSVSEKTVYRWIYSGAIPFTRVGDQYRFSRQELLVWAGSSGRAITPEVMEEPPVPDAKLPTLSDAVEEGGIYYRIDGNSSEAVIREIIAVMRLPSDIDRDYVLKSILIRESLASTGIGDGVAVPHMRYPMERLRQPQVSVCFPAQPVDWGAVDGKPVSVVFIPCAQSMRAHLHILSRISFVVRDENFKDLLSREASRSDILEYLTSTETENSCTGGIEDRNGEQEELS